MMAGRLSPSAKKDIHDIRHKEPSKLSSKEEINGGEKSTSLDAKLEEPNSADMNMPTVAAGKGKTTTKKVKKVTTKNPIRSEVQKLAETVKKQQKQQIEFQSMMMKMMQNVMPDAKHPNGNMAADNNMQYIAPMAGDDEDDGTYGPQADMPGTSQQYDHQISDDEESVASVNASEKCVMGAAMADHDPTVSGQAKLSMGFANRYRTSEEKGAPILQETANSLEILLVSDMDIQLREEAYKSHQTPSNCPLLLVPKVNQTIWDHLTPSTRSRDVKIQKVVKPMVTGLIAMAKTKNPNNDQEDAMALVANACFELNTLRKDLIKPELKKRYVHLCKPEVKPTALLFGDDLTKQVRDLDEQQKTAGGLVLRQNHGYGGTGRGRYAPYNTNTNRWRGRMNQAPSTYPNPFLGQNYYHRLMKQPGGGHRGRGQQQVNYRSKNQAPQRKM